MTNFDMNEGEQEAQRLIQAGRNLMDGFNRDQPLEKWVTTGHLVENGTGYAFNLPMAGKDYLVVVYPWKGKEENNGKGAS
jgi:hypothetical protein